MFKSEKNTYFSPEILRWVKTVSEFLSVQILVQILTTVTGIIIIRTLEPKQYAYFVIANTMQSTMNMLADIGVTIGMSSIGGNVWNERYRFSQLVVTAFYLRQIMAKFAGIIVLPLLLWLLIQNGATLGLSISLSLLVILEANVKLTTVIYQTALRLHSEIRRLQNSEFQFALVRFALIWALLGTQLSTVSALATATISSAWQRWLVGRWTRNIIDLNVPIHVGYKKEMTSLIISNAPNTLYYCIQGQLTIWLISIYGNTDHIAEVGALSRLTIVFALASSILTNIIIPSFSRAQKRQELIAKYVWILTGHLVFFSAILGFVSLFPSLFLRILGTQYMNLQKDVVLMCISTSVSSFNVVLWQLNASKGWVKESWLFVPVTIATQIVLLSVLDISTVSGVILFGMCAVIPAIFINFLMAYLGLKKVLT